eukprot:s565_g9.t1
MQQWQQLTSAEARSFFVLRIVKLIEKQTKTMRRGRRSVDASLAGNYSAGVRPLPATEAPPTTNTEAASRLFQSDGLPPVGMPLVTASGKAEEKRAALNQSSLGSTATGTPHSRDAREILTPSKEDFEDDVKVLRQPLGPSPGNFRRRRYVELTQQLMLQNVVLDREIKDHEVVIAGPLQQRFWGFLWRWRWCVLKGTSLFVYRDEGLTLTLILACPPHEAAHFVPIAQVEAMTNFTYSQMMPDAYRTSEAEDSKRMPSDKVSQEEVLRSAQFDLLRQLQKAVRTVILTATVSNSCVNCSHSLCGQLFRLIRSCLLAGCRRFHGAKLTEDFLFLLVVPEFVGSRAFKYDLEFIAHLCVSHNVGSFVRQLFEDSRANHFYCDCAIMRDEDFRTELPLGF